MASNFILPQFPFKQLPLAGQCSVSGVNQSANIPLTPLFAQAPGVVVPSFYRVSAIVVLTQAATTSSALPVIQLSFTGGITNLPITIDVTASYPAAVLQSGSQLCQQGSVTSNLLGGTSAQGTSIITPAANTTVSFLSSGYSSVGATPMQFFYKIYVEPF